MIKILPSANLAGKILLGAFILMLILYTMIWLQIVPSNLVWDGQINIGVGCYIGLDQVF